jgi:hypothetical protein
MVDSFYDDHTIVIKIMVLALFVVCSQAFDKSRKELKTQV